MKPITDTRAILGEGAIWYGERLYWIDIEGKRVYIYDPKAGTEEAIQLEERIGTVVPRASGGLVVALQSGFAFLDPESGAVTPVTDPEADKPHTRFNDGKCDPEGRFWAGTMALDQQGNQGGLYVLDRDGSVSQALDQVSISNGICWSHDTSTMYYVDTPTQQVFSFDYDRATGAICNRRVIVEIDPAEGSPDGMTIDERGYLWIALWNGWAVVCHDPATGKRHAKIDVPAERVTSCAFGGDDLADLYITSARVDLDDDELAEQPAAGGVFKTQVGTKGVPAFAYRG